MSTRKIMLFAAVVGATVYTVTAIVCGFADATLTTEVFSFLKWVVVSGAGITIAGKFGGDDKGVQG